MAFTARTIFALLAVTVSIAVFTDAAAVPCDHLCGKSCSSDESLENQHPWLVKVHVEDELAPRNCLGVIVDSDKILTSAFCVNYDGSFHHDVTRYQVTLATNNFKGALLNVSGVQFASNYSLEDGMRNNVGIIHTHENLLKMDNVMKICTGGSDMVGNIVGELATVVGRSRTREETVLVSGTYLIKDVEECKNLVRAKDAKYFDQDNSCAEFIQDQQNGCPGGFGAPLMFKLQDTWFLRGLYNVGLKNIKETISTCSNSQLVSFTDINHHASFIGVDSNFV